MTDDEIKALMRATDTDGYPSDLRRLVEAVQAREREACAVLCEAPVYSQDAAEEIQTRAYAVGFAAGRAAALTEEQIDRAIRDMGLNYVADLGCNRTLLRELCMRAHRIAPTVALTEGKRTLAQKVLDRLVLCYRIRPVSVADACDISIDHSGALLGWIRDAARPEAQTVEPGTDPYAPDPQRRMPPGRYVIKRNDDGEFGATTGWLYRQEGPPCAVSGQPVYVWRPLADLIGHTSAPTVALTEEQRREAFAAGYAAAEADAKVCHIPPPGWSCTREAGHAGPCAAVPNDDLGLAARGMERLRQSKEGGA